MSISFLFNLVSLSSLEKYPNMQLYNINLHSEQQGKLHYKPMDQTDSNGKSKNLDSISKETIFIQPQEPHSDDITRRKMQTCRQFFEYSTNNSNTEQLSSASELQYKTYMPLEKYQSSRNILEQEPPTLSLYKYNEMPTLRLVNPDEQLSHTKNYQRSAKFDLKMQETKSKFRAFAILKMSKKNQLLCRTNPNNDIIINFHCCQAKNKYCLYKNETKPGPCCLDFEHMTCPCFQIRFSQDFIALKQTEINQSKDNEKFKQDLFFYLQNNYDNIIKMYGKQTLNNILDNVILLLKNNKISIKLFFATLVFRIKNLESTCMFMLQNGNIYNLFESIHSSEIDLHDSIYKSLDMWTKIDFDEVNVGNNFYIVFNCILRNFFIFSTRNYYAQSYLLAFTSHIVNSYNSIAS
ncbi:hypothetical protein H311_03632 [Anncaliia algerae PRA109]|nr:hypothetical protein H311_03632 [Anncaliia algerae PRA109]